MNTEKQRVGNQVNNNITSVLEVLLIIVHLSTHHMFFSTYLQIILLNVMHTKYVQIKPILNMILLLKDQ